MKMSFSQCCGRSEGPGLFQVVHTGIQIGILQTLWTCTIHVVSGTLNFICNITNVLTKSLSFKYPLPIKYSHSHSKIKKKILEFMRGPTSPPSHRQPKTVLPSTFFSFISSLLLTFTLTFNYKKIVLWYTYQLTSICLKCFLLTCISFLQHFSANLINN